MIQRVSIALIPICGISCAISSACYAIAGNGVATGIYIVAGALFSISLELRILSNKEGK